MLENSAKLLFFLHVADVSVCHILRSYSTMGVFSRQMFAMKQAGIGSSGKVSMMRRLTLLLAGCAPLAAGRVILITGGLRVGPGTCGVTRKGGHRLRRGRDRGPDVA